MGRRRLAVALMLPDDLSAEVDGLRRGLGDDRYNIAPHLTLVPPINVRDERMVEALELVRSAAREIEPFDIDLGPATMFRPTIPVVYLAAQDANGSLVALYEAFQAEPMLREQKRRFIPHVTIANGGIEPGRIEAAVEALADFMVLWPVRYVTLLENGSPGPHRWNPITEARLGSSRG